MPGQADGHGGQNVAPSLTPGVAAAFAYCLNPFLNFICKCEGPMTSKIYSHSSRQQ